MTNQIVRSPIILSNKPYGYIYITTNKLNGKRYIGQHQGVSKDTRYYGSGVYLLRAISKYGKENFSVEIIDYAYTHEELNEKEKKWIADFDAVKSDKFYNLAEGGEGHNSEEAKRFITAETRKKLSQNSKGENNGMYGKGYKLIGENNGMFGKTHTEEVRHKLSERAKLSVGEKNAFYGKKHTQESIERMRRTKIGKKYSEETKLKHSLRNSGRKWFNNSLEEKFVSPVEFEEYTKNGWNVGRLPMPWTQKHKNTD